MADIQIKSKLFNDFPPVSKFEWDEKVVADLKGKNIEKLSWKSFEGFNAQPFYTKADLEKKEYVYTRPGDSPFRRGSKITNNNWLIRQDFIIENIDGLNDKVKLAIKAGITEAGFIIPSGRTLKKPELKDLITGINPEKVRLSFKTDIDSFNLLDNLGQTLLANEFEPNEAKGAIEYDPLGQLVQKGSFYSSEKADFELAGKMLQYCDEYLPGFNIISMSGNIFSNSGTSLSQELGFTLAMGAENIVKLADLGFDIHNISNRLQMSLGIGSNYFMEIAKVRAARQLWATIIQAFTPEKSNSKEIFIHSVPTLWNKTNLDPYVNMLRFATESLSAAIGGADSISIFPFNFISKKPGAFSERIARNTQVILKEESYINKIVDPGAGSYYIEKLTDLIASQAWDIFRQIENLGGFIAACNKGFIHDQIADSQGKRKNNIANRKEIFVGTNHYPDLNETEEDTVNNEIDPVQYETRGAFDFEELRKNIERSGDKKPVAILFPYGDVVMRTARTIFATNFFGVGGFEIKDLTGIKTIDEGIKICNEEKPALIICCSSDKEYPTFISQINENIHTNTMLVVAGYPEDSIEALKKQGVKYFVHIRSNILKTLTDILNSLQTKK